MFFILEFINSSCPDGWVMFQNRKCFKLFVDLKSQKRAQSSCESVDSGLATINSEDERTFLRDYLTKEVSVETYPYAWLAGHQRDGVGYWFDLSPFHVKLRGSKMKSGPEFDGIILDWNGESVSLQGGWPLMYICQKKLKYKEPVIG